MAHRPTYGVLYTTFELAEHVCGQYNLPLMETGNEPHLAGKFKERGHMVSKGGSVCFMEVKGYPQADKAIVLIILSQHRKADTQ